MKLTTEQKEYFESHKDDLFVVKSDSLGEGAFRGREATCGAGDWDLTEYPLNEIYDVIYEPERLGGNDAIVLANRTVYRLGDGDTICEKCWLEENPNDPLPDANWIIGKCDICGACRN